LIPELSRNSYQGTALAVPIRAKDATGFSPSGGGPSSSNSAEQFLLNNKDILIRTKRKVPRNGVPHA
jgi:hypothetical protein